MRRKIVAGNWKMNKNYEDGLALASEIVHIAADEVPAGVELILCTPFIHLASVAKLAGSIAHVQVGAQNCHTKASGAYTGEISTEMIQSVGAKYVIVGHSERREYFHEDSEMLLAKTKAVLAQGLTPIFCCGESLSQREAGGYLEFVAQQLTETVLELTEGEFEKIIIAYEPIWAIGTGLTASNEQAQEMHAYLRTHLAKKFAAASNTPILYGGSVKASNAKEIFACADVDGGLVGGASLQSREFINIAKGF